MDARVNDKQTYKLLKRDPTPALQRKLNNKLLTLKKTNAFDTQCCYPLRCSVPQPPKLYGLPKLHKPGIPMRPIVSSCGCPKYQLSKYLMTILRPLTDKSTRKLQSILRTLLPLLTYSYLTTRNLCPLMWNHCSPVFHLKWIFSVLNPPFAIQQTTDTLPLPTEDIMDLLNLCLTLTYFQYTGITSSS